MRLTPSEIVAIIAIVVALAGLALANDGDRG